jgi:C4-dicarboxylate transporter
MIDNGLAYLVGGNVSNTAKIVGTLKVDSDGTLQEPIYNYIVILKKKRNLGMIISVLGVAGLLGLYVLRGRK